LLITKLWDYLERMEIRKLIAKNPFGEFVPFGFFQNLCKYLELETLDKN